MWTKIPLPNANTQRGFVLLCFLFYAFRLLSAFSSFSLYVQKYFMWFVCRWNLLYAFSVIICSVEKIHLQIFDSGAGRGREEEWVENVIQSDVHQNGLASTAKWQTANDLRSAKYLHGIYVKWKQNSFSSLDGISWYAVHYVRFFFDWSRHFMATSMLWVNFNDNLCYFSSHNFEFN